ncbi:hypothetical protein C8R43DRAFT_1124033 [Mycena crocata]|nr:hypothetical protein C8R43DRAFT_1124033 [Mycena crocata]
MTAGCFGRRRVDTLVTLDITSTCLTAEMAHVYLIQGFGDVCRPYAARALADSLDVVVELFRTWPSPPFGISIALAMVETLRETVFGLDWDTIKDRIGSLNSEATIATFLAAVQSQIIALSYQDNSTKLKIATNVLGFAGVLLDVLAACLALLASTLLQRHTAIVEKQLDSIEDASQQRIVEIQDLFTTLPRFMVPHDLRQRVQDRFIAVQNQNTESQGATTGPEPAVRISRIHALLRPVVQRHERGIASMETSFRAIQSVAYIVDMATIAMFWGVLCFFSSVLCLAISTQPRPVWIVSAAICSLAVVLPLVNEVLGWIRISVVCPTYSILLSLRIPMLQKLRVSLVESVQVECQN